VQQQPAASPSFVSSHGGADLEMVQTRNDLVLTAEQAQAALAGGAPAG
jgi:hypothetical protein